MKKAIKEIIQKLFFILTPSVLTIIVCSFIIGKAYMEFNSTEGWSMVGSILFFPILGAAVGLRLLTLLLFRKRILITWLFESTVLIIGAIYYFEAFF